MGGSGVQGYPWLHNKLKANLGYMKLDLKKIIIAMFPFCIIQSFRWHLESKNFRESQHPVSSIQCPGLLDDHFHHPVLPRDQHRRWGTREDLAS